VLLSLEDELAVLDLRYADLLQSVQTLNGSDEEDVEVRLLSPGPVTQLLMLKYKWLVCAHACTQRRVECDVHSGPVNPHPDMKNLADNGVVLPHAACQEHVSNEHAHSVSALWSLYLALQQQAVTTVLYCRCSMRICLDLLAKCWNQCRGKGSRYSNCESTATCSQCELPCLQDCLSEAILDCPKGFLDR